MKYLVYKLSMHAFNKRARRLFIQVSLAFNIINVGNAQVAQSTPQIGLMGIYYNDSIYLRWAPTTIESFNSAVAEGFSLKRGLFAVNGVVEPQDSFEANIITLDNAITLIAEEDWDEVEVSSEIKNAAVELFYNFQYSPPDFDSINIFEAVEEEERKSTFIAISSIIADRDWNAAKAIGWAYKDAPIDSGHQYIYILTLLDTDEKFYTSVHTDIEYQLKDIPKPKAYPGEKLVKLTFDKYGIDDYYGYYIQRSGDGGQTFDLIRNNPVMYDDERNPNQFNFIDSLPDNENVYVFRISGVNAFGLQSEWSDTVSVKGIPGPLTVSPMISEIVEDGTGVDVMFSFPEELESEILKFEVIRSLNREGPFLNLVDSLTVSTREFHDDSPLHSNFYFVRAIDKNGYPLLSMPHYYAPVDSISASIPVGLGGSIDNNNVAFLSWDANPEHDIKGYKLYGANGLQGLFIEITPGTIGDTTYQYQLGNNVLNTEWYVKIKSIDYNENESVLSEAVLISRPDLIPPSSPVLKDLNSFAFGVAMNWIQSSSEDVVSHLLQRKISTNNNWLTILDITNNYSGKVSTNGWQEGSQDAEPSSFNYVDSTTEARVVYEYRILAIDAGGNIASSSILKATGHDDGLRGEIFNLMAVDMPYTAYATTSYTLDKDHAGIAVGWDYTDTLGVHLFIIYRSADKWPFKAHQSYLVFDERPNPAATSDNTDMSAGLSGLTSRYIYIDKDVKPGKVYKYKILAKHLDGGFSQMSEVVSVTATIQK